MRRHTASLKVAVDNLIQRDLNAWSTVDQHCIENVTRVLYVYTATILTDSARQSNCRQTSRDGTNVTMLS